MLQTQQILDTVETIYEAAQDFKHWESVMLRVADLFESAQSTLILHPRGRPDLAVERTIRFDPEIAARFSQRRELEDEWARRSLQKPGVVHRGSALISPAELKKTALYADLIQPLDAEHMLGGFVEAGAGGVAGFSVLRSAKRGEYTDREVEAMNCLFPHIRRAFHMHAQFAAALEKAASFDHSLELMVEPVFIIDTHGTVRFHNSAAEVILTAPSGVRLRGKKLRFTSRTAQEWLDRTISAGPSSSNGPRATDFSPSSRFEVVQTCLPQKRV